MNKKEIKPQLENINQITAGDLLVLSSTESLEYITKKVKELLKDADVRDYLENLKSNKSNPTTSNYIG